MSKLGSEKAKMTAFRKRRSKADQAALRSLGKSMSRSARSAKKAVGGSQKRKASHSAAAGQRPAAPLSPGALKVRVIAIVVAVVGGLLSQVAGPVGSLLCIAGIVAAVMARKIAGWVYGEDTSDSE